MSASRPYRILITGGAGFVGSNLAVRLAHHLDGASILCLDNLKRRGSELALQRLSKAGVAFQHGDIRNPEDLAEAGRFDLLIECSAEPSVHAGYDGSPSYLVNTNLVGTVHCLDAARRCGGDIIFLSTSRVYPIDSLRALPLERRGDRLVIRDGAAGTGWSARGITVDFPMRGSRSLYGATKLSSELLIEEYAALYGLRSVVNRCGVLTGPWQMGKVDQGFVVLWAARHLFGGPLGYSGFGGEGIQVRDILHVDDLFDLVRRQIAGMDHVRGQVFNVGGGLANSTSLAELTDACALRVDCRVAVASTPETRPADIPWYVTDNTAVTEATGWTPTRSVDMILDDIFQWLGDHRHVLEPVLR
ncbi:NAD-dependent epimerase/dehydratase family protein [Azospirillum tabaci]|uniref:NAD-dependent epimerase/dehydratase family protein n=1 Tax=Azospirillum tabaci TaxID=2752310 RepID=UPI00166010C9|nr:NAD-dependent epimerase/dehydratase family protein [Azospirillum tabaci]